MSTPAPYTSVLMTREVMETINRESLNPVLACYPSFLLGQYVNSTILITDALGSTAMSKGVKSVRSKTIHHHERGWRHGLGAGLKRQSQVAYLGLWLHDSNKVRWAAPPPPEDLEFYFKDELFNLPGIRRSNPFCILRVTGDSGALKYRAELIDRKTRIGWELKVHLP